MLKISLKQLFLAEAVGFVLLPEARMDTGFEPLQISAYPYLYPKLLGLNRTTLDGLNSLLLPYHGLSDQPFAAGKLGGSSLSLAISPANHSNSFAGRLSLT